MKALDTVLPTSAVVIEHKFHLENDPYLFTLGIHVNNLLAYFRPENVGLRTPSDKGVSSNTRGVLEKFNFLFLNPGFAAEYENMRNLAPIEFRCAQLIHHYGVDMVKNYLRLIYGETLIG